MPAGQSCSPWASSPHGACTLVFFLIENQLMLAHVEGDLQGGETPGGHPPTLVACLPVYRSCVVLP